MHKITNDCRLSFDMQTRHRRTCVEATNHFELLNYGACWFRRPLYYDDVVSEFKERFPDRPVTVAGRDHFKGAMQLGHSYIHVTREFGEFVRKAIDAHRCESGETDQ